MRLISPTLTIRQEKMYNSNLRTWKGNNLRGKYFDDYAAPLMGKSKTYAHIHTTTHPHIHTHTKKKKQLTDPN